MTIAECVTSGAVYIRIVADDLDELLAAELGECTHKKAVDITKNNTCLPDKT